MNMNMVKPFFRLLLLHITLETKRILKNRFYTHILYKNKLGQPAIRIYIYINFECALVSTVVPHFLETQIQILFIVFSNSFHFFRICFVFILLSHFSFIFLTEK